MRIAKSLVATLCLLPATAGAARAEFLDWSVPAPTLGGGATSYSMTLQGNVVADINATQTQNDATLNPFQYVNQNFFGGIGTTSVTASLNGGGNTVVSFTGSNPVLSSYHFGSNGLPNVGINGSVGSPVSGGGPAFKLLSQAWSNASTTTQMPTLTASGLGTVGLNVKYVTLFADITSGGQTVGQWFEIPYTPGTSPQLTLTNYTTGSETLSNIGFQLSSTLIPLDNLNFNDDPPPGSPGSSFTPLPAFDGQSLSAGDGTGDPGGSFSADLPEPSSLLLLATGIFGTAGCFRKRRIG
jgi:PEP-CTERM motif